jgi:anti-sigma regulatory factor (Ser/Thr protein kinase)
LVIAAGLGDLRSSAELLTSEVVTNAVVHAGTDMVVTVSVRPRGLRVEVADGSPDAVLLSSSPGSEPEPGGGRGLLLVQMMASGWGVEPVETGKIVWFELTDEAAAG